MTREQLKDEIHLAKKERNAVILAHNYQPDEIQGVADFTGDSLELSRKAVELAQPVIVFCGGRFIAESVAILNPKATVLLPLDAAGCALADTVTAEQIRILREEHPGAVVICNVNSSAEVKAESDCCCTSANAEAVVEAFRYAPEIIFVPDRNLGGHTATETGAQIVTCDGYCPVHVRLSGADVEDARQQHPHALVMVHPECAADVREGADKVLSTGQMCEFAITSGYKEFAVGTECGILYRLRRENPDKSFYPLRRDLVCTEMKRITPEDVLASLRDLKHPVQVPEAIAERARSAIEKMIHLG